jgi:hypothetical protein
MSYYTSGLGVVDPGIDVSHYGAPYQGMLGLGAWSPAPGQTPADDPRIVKQFANVRVTYKVRNVPPDKTADAATAMLTAARTAFAPNRVRKASGSGFGNGWGPGGRVGVDIIVRHDTRYGELRQKSKSLQNRNVVSGVSPGAQLLDARSYVKPGMLMDSGGAAAPGPIPDDPVLAPEVESGPLLTRKVAGVPVWALGGLGLAAIGGLAFMATRKKPVAANRRRRRRRRR